MPYMSPSQAPLHGRPSHSTPLSGRHFHLSTSLTQKSQSTLPRSPNHQNTLALATKSASILNSKSTVLQLSPFSEEGNFFDDIQGQSTAIRITQKEQENRLRLPSNRTAKINPPPSSVTHPPVDDSIVLVHVVPVKDDEHDEQVEHTEHVERVEQKALSHLPEAIYNSLDKGSSGCITLYDAETTNAFSNKSNQYIGYNHERETKASILKKTSPETTLSALRPHSAKPGNRNKPRTSICHKTVHFDDSLEHVRYFLQVDMPFAVSTDSSVVEACYNEAEICGDDGYSDDRSSQVEWELLFPNFPVESPQHLSLPVRVERVFIISSNIELIGCVTVSNLAFKKDVIVRYTLDDWNSYSDIAAEFIISLPKLSHSGGHDLFKFKISLAGQGDLEPRTLLFCVKYNVNSKEYWDNNNSANYQVNFKRRLTGSPKDDKDKGRASAQRSHILLQTDKSALYMSGRQESIPPAFKHFAQTYNAANADELKHLINDNLTQRSISTRGLDRRARLTPSANRYRLSNRYNFDVSLSAVIRRSSSTLNQCSTISTKRLPTTKTASLADKSYPRNANNSPKVCWNAPLLPDSSGRDLVSIY